MDKSDLGFLLNLSIDTVLNSKALNEESPLERTIAGCRDLSSNSGCG